MKLVALPGVADVGVDTVADEAAARAAHADLVLGQIDNRLSLWRPEGHETPLSVDFTSGALGYRLAADRVRHERLVRAVGKQSDNGLLIDATAGLGRDSALLAQAGWQVSMLERQPVLQALLADGLARAPELASHLSLIRADSTEWLQQHPRCAEVVYLDPMFPERENPPPSRKSCSGCSGYAEWIRKRTKPLCLTQPCLQPDVGWWSSARCVHRASAATNRRHH